MAETYDVYFGTVLGGLTLQESGISTLSAAMPVDNVLEYDTDYQWRIDASDGFHTVTGDVWYFSTMLLYPPLPTGVTWPSTGTPSGENNIMTIKKAVAAAKNKIYYEGI